MKRTVPTKTSGKAAALAPPSPPSPPAPPAPAAKARDASVSSNVYRDLLGLILTGQLAPGSAISEKQIAEKLGVSRTPVHNAVLQLVKDGLVTQEANHRPLVNRITRADVEEIFDMRRLLEGEASRRAATRIDRGTLARLNASVKSLEGAARARDGLSRWADFDDDFHDAIAQACGSARLAADIQRYRMVHHALNRLRMTADLIPQALAEHVSILDALAARDGEAAARAMDTHLTEWRAFYVHRFDLSD